MWVNSERERVRARVGCSRRPKRSARTERKPVASTRYSAVKVSPAAVPSSTPRPVSIAMSVTRVLDRAVAP
nr:hypothetical protein [Nocardia farcinica]